MRDRSEFRVRSVQEFRETVLAVLLRAMPVSDASNSGHAASGACLPLSRCLPSELQAARWTSRCPDRAASAAEPPRLADRPAAAPWPVRGPGRIRARPAVLGIDPVEGLEDPRLMLRRNADAGGACLRLLGFRVLGARLRQKERPGALHGCRRALRTPCPTEYATEMPRRRRLLSLRSAGPARPAWGQPRA